MVSCDVQTITEDINQSPRSIFTYDDYRDIIRNYIEIHQLTESEFSIKLGLGRTTINSYLIGNRLPNEKVVIKLIETFDLTELEARYFRLLLAKASKDHLPNHIETLRDLFTLAIQELDAEGHVDRIRLLETKKAALDVLSN
jgi:transcriptional regulator with XRE-family HTH domain